ncbi:hypothetical protein BOX15_Mlig017956g1 [Macrostomum lignano]|uniref:Uncharacterized protein n=2 Tax=Macrostomum lignano TaxID=282301 RepID=A0A267GQG2_9PLAT|nr:hypothetical protein BOX15_Mlig017956g1 [Macrostomum lignano]
MKTACLHQVLLLLPFVELILLTIVAEGHPLVDLRKVSCKPYEQIYCANGGSCTVTVIWSLLFSRNVKRIDRPTCECPIGYSGYNCDIPELPPYLLSYLH